MVSYPKLPKISIKFQKFLENLELNFDLLMVSYHKLPVKLPKIFKNI